MIVGREAKSKSNFISLNSLPLVAFFLVFPILFLPVFGDAYNLPKTLFLLIISAAMTIIWLADNFRRKAFSITITPFLSALFFLSLVIGLSVWFASGNYHISLLGLPTNFFLAFLFFVAATSYYGSKQVVKTSLIALVLASTVLSILFVYQFFDLLPSVVPWAVLKNNKLWTPAGGIFEVLFYAVSSLIISFVFAWQERHEVKKIAYFLATALSALAAGVVVYALFGGAGADYVWQHLPIRTSWVIALEVVKNYPLLGVGPGMFITAFNRFRDVGFNLTPNWNNKFFNSANTPFNFLSELGFLGLAGWLVFWWLVLKLVLNNWKRSVNDPSAKSLSMILIFSFIYQLLVPASGLIWVMIIMLLALYIIIGQDMQLSFISRLLVSLETAVIRHSQSLGYRSGMILNTMVGLIILIIFGLNSAILVRYAQAEQAYANSIKASNQNDVRDLLNNLNLAIQRYPWLTKYHINVAQIHSNIIASLLKKDPKELTDDDKKQLQASIQVALSQARIAVKLNPADADTWAFLARTYSKIIGLAKGADGWAIDTYRQALVLNPVDPILRTELAGLLYSLNQTDEALSQARLATQSKVDYANAWYNMSLIYRKKKDYPQAFAAMQRVWVTLPFNSPDRQKAQSELDELKKKVQEMQQQQQQQQQQPNQPQPPAQQASPTLAPLPTPTPILSEPTPISTPSVSPIELPQDEVQPPTTPTLTPTPIPTP